MKTLFVFLVIVALVVVGCEKSIEPVGHSAANVSDIDEEMSALMATAKTTAFYPPPAGLVTVGYDGNNLDFWPYSGTDFSGTPQDPINLIFCGHADPRDIRTALMSLDGDRTAFGYPPVQPFNSTWEDAIGDMQTSYGTGEGWNGSPVQLACGPYGPLRFHIRFFKMGEWTVANAHFEVQIPGTADHQVLSWEKAEQFVMVDLIRSGLVDPSTGIVPTDQINDSPFRTIMKDIYNELPLEIRGFIEGPLGNVGADVPIGTDGHALVINILGALPPVSNVYVQDFIINYGQVVPRPFCSSGPMDYVYVEGPVQMTQTVKVAHDGSYAMDFQASGTLTVIPFDPINMVPIGDPLTAEVRETHAGRMNEWGEWSSSVVYQKLMPVTEPGSGRLFKWLHVGTGDRDGFMASVWCGGGQFASKANTEEAAGILSASNMQQ
ncbi:MAG: hypothetical protein CVT49_07715 [candidate division Zixibacteria bacterium HGW-Zixibacteria-1]|nr:MAG: hypothetical protein CVT49_07715 [candidate division Zixibacteria bacterium HGW-Zixibacteria-1]